MMGSPPIPIAGRPASSAGASAASAAAAPDGIASALSELASLQRLAKDPLDEARYARPQTAAGAIGGSPGAAGLAPGTAVSRAADEEVLDLEDPPIQLKKNPTPKGRAGATHTRPSADLHGPLIDRARPPPQARPAPSDYSTHLNPDNILEDNFTTLLTDTTSIIDTITATVNHRTAALRQHGQNDGLDFSPYVLTADYGEDDDDDDPPFSETPLASAHQQLRSTAFTGEEIQGLYFAPT